MAVNPLRASTCSEKQLNALVSISRVLTYSLLLLIYSGCDRAQASREKNAAKARAELHNLELTRDQIAFIEKNVANLIAARTYWTSRYADVAPSYVANAGRKVPAKYISFECAVIVWVDELRNESVGYVKMPDGRLDYPASVDWTSGAEDIEDLIKAGKMRPGNWDRFVMMLDYEPELRLAREQKDKYSTQFISRKEHWVTDAEITLPPLGPPRYDPMNETKGLLLDRILKASAHQADLMFEKQESVSITVPDFNVGESFVWVLIRTKNGGGVIVSIDLTTDPKEHPVLFSGVVTYDISANRYGLGEEARSARMIRQRALKIVRHTIKNQA